MLDSDLAAIYGVSTKRLNEQVKRNLDRFPADFMFQLTAKEAVALRSQIATSSGVNQSQIATGSKSRSILKSQIATSSLMSQFVTSSGHGGRRKLPWAFTEHGALMLASVLNSEVAVQASVRVVRAFVKLREMIAANAQLAAKLEEFERRFDSHDKALVDLFAALKRLLEPPAPPKKREIGFHVREKAARYHVQRRSRIKNRNSRIP